MNITSCPQCGGRVRSVSIGWKCEGCNGFIDISGQFHEHKDESFMPPMTNADRIRAMSNEKLAILLCRIMDCSICKRNIQKDGECDNYSADGLSKAVLNWLQRPAEEDT